MGKSVTATHDGRADQAGRVHARSAGADSRMAEARRSRDRRSASPTSSTCRAASGSKRRMIPTSIRRAPIPTTSISTPAAINSFQYAATRPPQWPPNTVGRYRNTDPVLTNYLIRLAVEKRGEEYLSFPQRNLFDKIGIRIDGHGNRPVRELPDARLRAHVGPRLGASRQSLSAGWRLERRADSSRGVRQIRQHRRASVGRGPPARFTAASSGSMATAPSPCPKRRSTWPARAARPCSSSRRTISWSSGSDTTRARSRAASVQASTDAADGGSTAPRQVGC